MMDFSLAVITTRQIVNHISEILNVYHDMDGDWQFIGNETVTEKDAVVLSLGQIVELDKTIMDVLVIDVGYSAHRKSKNEKWRILKDE